MWGLEHPGGLAALTAVVVLVVLLRFGRRTRIRAVGSLWLWRQVPAAPLRRRQARPDLLFWLQVAAVLALATALARPWWTAATGPAGGAPLLAVLDVSASMQTREAGGTRLEQARARLDAALVELPAGTPAMLVAAGTRAHVVVRWSTDRAAVRRALAALVPTDEPTRLPIALALAEGEQRRRPGTRVVVATDRPPPPDAGTVTWHAVGTTDDNAGITGLSVDAPPFAPARDAVVLATVRNFAARPRVVTLRADVDGTPWTSHTLALPARAATRVRLDGPPRDGVVTLALDGSDALAADDRAVTALVPARPLDLLLVSDSDDLASALSDLVDTFPDAQLEVVNPAGLRERDAGARTSSPHPVAILDGVVPRHEAALARPLLLVAPPPDNDVCPGRSVVEGATVVDWDERHPILDGLDGLAALGVARATVLRRPRWGTEVLRAASARASFPLLLAGEVDGWRRACLAASLPTPLTDADALPLMMVTLSALRWLGERATDAPVVTRTGEAVRAAGEALTGTAAVRAAGTPPVLVAMRAGVHRLRTAAGGERLVLASLLDDTESDIGRAAAAPVTVDAPADEVPRRLSARRPMVAWLLALAALLLTGEWLVWGRR